MYMNNIIVIIKKICQTFVNVVVYKVLNHYVLAVIRAYLTFRILIKFKLKIIL